MSPKKGDTGKSSPYSPDDIEELAAIVARATRNWDAFGHGGVPTKMQVTANIEWSGAFNPRPHRTTTMDGPAFPLAGVLAAGRAYDDALKDIDRAHRAYPAKGWYAQLREIEGTQRGRAAADAVGIDVSRRTLTAWLSQQQEPSKANREKIAEAYGSLRAQRIGLAASRVGKAADAVESALTAAMKTRYGAEIRLRDITDLGFMP